MKKQAFYIITQLLILFTFFIEGFQIKNPFTKKVTGIQAILSPDFPMIGRIVLAYIFLSVMFHSIILLYELVKKGLSKKMDDILTAIVTIQMISGLLVVTFIGTFLLWGGFLMIGIIVVSVFAKYKYFQ